ncbi:MAG: 4Fe-4S dicluster domain-containing protein [Caldilineaceae bacterium SB0668_bin_21]|nr:4Fe-4S dicluster domain-containing protein [Caldilineaceae bacterium SB0668_bin_21]MYC23490.1 4Fe-4S dicluster domain-containing protein [Caldilineaceae bacterium SB0662_bin_25]
MRHSIPVDSLGPQAPSMAEAVANCVHCGFCLPACPTYLALGEEMDSPRGRIILMKGALEGELSQEEVLPHVDRCLGCLACVTACPSGVEYGELLTPFREMTEKGRNRSAMEELSRTLTNQTLPYPGRFRAAAILGRYTKFLKPFLPAALQTMLDLLPERLPPRVALPRLAPARGERRARVALLSGCAQQVLAPGINSATVEVLTSNGVEVVIPPRQVCCGALSMHTGAADQARALARRNFDAFNLDEVDAVVTNAAGCGSGMHEYPLLFAGEPEEQAAREFADKVQDVTVFLDALGIVSPPGLPEPLTVAYHDACHLAHAQGVTDAPRRLLAAVQNLTLVPIPEGEICCGSAGSYNIDQPEIAAELGHRKARAILSTGAQAVITGNIGCMTQIDNHLRRLGKQLPIYHTVELLTGSEE